MNTPFDDNNKDFTDKAHAAARTQVYPHLFASGGVEIEIENVSVDDSDAHEILDQRLGVDVIIRATPPVFEQSIPIYVQERFRRPEYRHHQDITITKFNNKSDEVSEISKIAAQVFIYGYYEPALDEIQEAICVNTTVLLRQIIDGGLANGERQNPKEQDFITISFDELQEAGAVAFHLNRTNDAGIPLTIDRRQDITAYAAGGGSDE